MSKPSLLTIERRTKNLNRAKEEIYMAIKSLKYNKDKGKNRIYEETLRLERPDIENEIYKLISLICHK